MQFIDVSLFCSAVRPKLWKYFLDSLESTTISYEVFFSGFNTQEEVRPFYYKYSRFKYVHTKRIKPSQNYEIARRHCTGETVVWVADDCEFVGDIIGKAYKYWKSQNNEKLILSLQTKESGYGQLDGKLYDMKTHTFYSNMPGTPLMAPICLMSRNFLDKLGGFDRRFVCGQWENSAVMRAYQNGATVEIFGDEQCHINIDHLGKSIALGESTDEQSFLERPFAKGYQIDRRVLENSWTTFDEREVFLRLQAGERPVNLRKMSNVQLDKFEPYEDKDILIKSQSNNIVEMWE